jgi:hypothetical protein
LQDALRFLRDRKQLLEELLGWLQGAEATLRAVNTRELPMDNLDAMEQCLADHDDLEAEMTRRQPDHDTVIKYALKRIKRPSTSGSIGDESPSSRSSGIPTFRGNRISASGASSKSR